MNIDLDRIKAAIRWLIDHWYIPVTAIVSALGYALTRQGPQPQERVQVEMDAVAAKREVRRQALEESAAAAHARVAQMYAAHQDKLTEENRHAAEQLSADPEALAAFLVRAGARLPAAAPPPSRPQAAGNPGQPEPNPSTAPPNPPKGV